MAIYFTFLVLLMSLILSAIAVDNNASRNDLNVAIEEMQTANYFSFVMLINMLPPDRVPANITFLMPNDRMLSKISIPEDAVNEFLLRHSIPSPLLFDHLEHFPTGSMIPTSEPNYMLKVSNNGRRSFQLNNVQIISPNICTAGVSIRCHGINGFLTTAQPEQNRAVPSPTCTSASPQEAAAPASQPRPSPSPPSVDPLNLIPTVAPSPNGSQKSGSSLLLAEVLLGYIMTCMILALVALQI